MTKAAVLRDTGDNNMNFVEIILEKRIRSTGNLYVIFINDFEEVDIKLVKCAHYMKFSLRVNT